MTLSMLGSIARGTGHADEADVGHHVADGHHAAADIVGDDAAAWQRCRGLREESRQKMRR